MCRVLQITSITLLVGAVLGLGFSRLPSSENSRPAQSGATASSSREVLPTKPAQPFTSLPDKGDLVAYEPSRSGRRQAASTWYQASISEAHALRSVLSGEMVVSAPDGTPLRVEYVRHIEHSNGNWTWLGRSRDGQPAIVTFGEKAVFGTIPYGHNELRLTTSGGRAWVVEVDPGKELHPEPKKPDYLVPPELAAALTSIGPSTASVEAEAAGAAAAAATTVDVALGYTAGFASELGGDSQAVTRLQHLVDVTNQAYAASQIDAQIRLVRAVSVGYVDATSNDDALTKLSGYKSGTGPVPVDPAFNGLRSARDQYGADLVSLVRRFRTPENGGCGLAWLIGGNQSRIDGSDAPFGYSVVSDDIDKGDRNESDGQLYACRKESLAHELGHNMGQNHNVDDAGGDSGAHSYSYGYRETATNGFYTVMAYKLAGSSQRSVRYFANPNVMEAVSGRPTGVANSSDNARSMAQTMPIIATFRSTVVIDPAVPFPGSLIGIGGKCVDASNGATGNGTPIQVWACNGLRQQIWVPNAGSGSFATQGATTVLDVIGYGTFNGTQLQLWSSTGATNQAWRFTQASIMAGGGRVLDAVGVSSANGTRMQLWDDLGGSNQRWNFNLQSGQITGIDGKCLDVTGFNTANGTPVQFWTCNGTDNQKWSWGPNGTIRGYGGKCLEAANGGTGNGTEVRMWDCNGGAHQTWRIRGEVRSSMTGKCLDDPNAGTANGSRVHMWDCHGGQNQKWEFSSK